MLDRRKPGGFVMVHQIVVVVLLLTLLIVGFYHYWSLDRNQRLISYNLEQVQLQYVKLQTYLVGQTDQDARIEKLQSDIAEIEKLVKERKIKH